MAAAVTEPCTIVALAHWKEPTTMLAFALCLSALSIAPKAAPAAQSLVVAERGASRYVIVLPTKAVPSEQKAASELQTYLKQSTGAALPIVDEKAGRRAKARFWLGQSDAVRKLVPGVKWDALGADGIVLKTVGRDLVLTGGRPRGVLYAVYELLEKAVGVRWWDEAATLVPKHARLTVAPLDTTYVPKIVCREPHYYLPNNDGVWAAHNRANGHFHRVPPEFGGHMSIIGWCHTFYQLIPPEKYLAAHPEWFSLIDGKRTSANAQLCLTNEEVRKELTRNALEWIRKDPTAGFISIAQNDCAGPCQCPQCRAIVAEDGSESGPVVRFVNAVAEDIEKEFPDFRVETLAYWYTRKAPKVSRPRRNVTIRLCSIECDYGLPLTAPRNKSFMDDLEAWSAIAPQLFIWSYIASFGDYYYPNPTLPVLAPNIRAFASHHAVGVFMQGDSYNAASCFARLRAWVIAKLLWNPDFDQRALVDEYLNGYYGAAGPVLKRYLHLIDAAYARRAAGDWMTPADVLAGYAILAQAEKAVAGDAALLARVRRERLPLDYLWATRHRQLVKAAKAAGGELPGPEKIGDAVALLGDDTVASKSLYRAEGQPAASWLEGLLQQYQAAPAGPPASLGNLPAGSYEDLQEPDFRLFGVGDWVTIVDDAAASNGKAARMTTHHTQWAVQTQLDTIDPGRYRVYAAVRAAATDAQAKAVTVGVYDTAKSAGVLSRDVPAAEIAGAEYKLLDLGVVEATPSCYVWFAPNANPQQVQGVWVDRVFLVKQ